MVLQLIWCSLHHRISPWRFGIQIRWTDVHKLRHSIHLQQSWSGRYREETDKERNKQEILKTLISCLSCPLSLLISTDPFLSPHHRCCPSLYYFSFNSSVSINRALLSDRPSQLSEWGTSVFRYQKRISFSLPLFSLSWFLLSVDWLRNRACKYWMLLF